MSNDLVLHADDPSRCGWLTPHNIEAGLRLAEMMAKAKLVPEHLRGSPGDCLLVIAQAVSWRLNPISVAQATAVVRGRLCYEGKLVAAVLTSLGAIEGRLTYDISGEGPKMSITVTGTPRGGKPVSVTGSVAQWRTDNGHWDRDPRAMLIYRGTRQWARIYAPEAMLGVMTPDEAVYADSAEDVIPATAQRVEIPPAQVQAQDPEPAPPTKTRKGQDGKHPSIAAATGLFYALPADIRKSALSRLVALYGVKAAPEIPPEMLDDYGQRVAQLRSILEDHGLDAMTKALTVMEAEAREAQK